MKNLKRSRRLIHAGDERGAALVLALAVLVGVSAVALSLLSLGALEPQIATNHADMLRAQYLAEAGMEYALNLLASTAGSWHEHLATATCTNGAVVAHWPLPGLAEDYGMVTVRVRNDCAPGDDRLTGVAVEPPTAAAMDGNGRLVVSATGSVRQTTHGLSAIVGPVEPNAGQSVPTRGVKAYNWADQ